MLIIIIFANYNYICGSLRVVIVNSRYFKGCNFTDSIYFQLGTCKMLTRFTLEFDTFQVLQDKWCKSTFALYFVSQGRVQVKSNWIEKNFLDKSYHISTNKYRENQTQKIQQ